jgi:TonB-linked SusC/RagA family outer membrane protein
MKKKQKSRVFLPWHLNYELKMRISLLLFITLSFAMQANSSYGQKTKISIDKTQATLKEIINDIELSTDFKFLFITKTVNLNKKVSIRVKKASIQNVIETLFDTSKISYEIDGRKILLKSKEINNDLLVNSTQTVEIKAEPQIIVNGKITDANSNPLLGVNIIEKGTNNGATADFDGNFSINVEDGNAVLVISSIGYISIEVPINGRTTLNIILEEDTSGLEEVVIVGYGVQSKKDLTGAISIVKTEDYKDQPVTRVDQILQGRTPGVNVTNSSGAPGGTVSIRIRGANSINGSNEPLYVIDGFVGADFRDVNPADIESMQVLKDASSTAIYGSRGSNGVVLITTKSGRIGKPRISFTVRGSISNSISEWDLLDAATFAQVVNERAASFGQPAKFTQSDIDQFRINGGTDWQDELFITGYGQEYQLNYSGGSDKVSYFVSGNYLNQTGIVVNSDFTRFGLRTNIKADLTDKLTADIKMNFNKRETNNVNGEGNTSGALAGPLTWAPTTPARDENGQFTILDPTSSIKANPLESAYNDNISEVNILTANGSLNYEFFEGLTLNVGYGLSYSNTQNKDFSLQLLIDTPSASRSSTESLFLQNTNNLTYKKTFNDVHNLTVTGVFENQTRKIDGFGTNASNLLYPIFKYDNLTLVEASSSYAIKRKETLLSYIGRLNYGYMDKYLLTASVRSDGSSKFRGNNRYSTFPSVALGWRITKENFMQNSFFDELKLRASWGQTGSQAIGPFGTVTTLATDENSGSASFDGNTLLPGIVLGNPGNSDLKWETTDQINFGIDMQFFNNRMGMSLDYYEKSTKDLLLNTPLPLYVGGGIITENVGQVDNSGFEIGINAAIVNNDNFKWDATFNGSFLKNNIANLGDLDEIFLDGSVGGGITNMPENILTPGHSISSYWGLNYLGTWKTSQAAEAAQFGNVPGDSRYQDINGDSAINGDDYMIIGQGMPKATYGLNNIISYKNFTINIFFNAMTGYDKWNFGYATGIMPNVDAREVIHVDILDRWEAGTNENSNIPQFSPTSLEEIQSSRFIESGDFVRLKNLSVAYDIPKEKLGGLGIQVLVSGTNLITWTNYKGLDPESFSNNGIGDSSGGDAGSYPNSKTWTVGINLNF